MSDHPAVPDFDATGQACLNCGTERIGDWCHDCGQKKLNPEQQTLRWLLGQFIGKLTSMDGKLPRSLAALAFQPGRLGRDWLEGRRVRWTSPFALFLVVNLLYFLSPPVTDFNLPLIDQLNGQWYSGWVLERVDARFPSLDAWLTGFGPPAAPEGYREFEERFNQRSEGLSKTLLILHVPLLALALLLLHPKRRLHYVEHFVVALHQWTFLLLMLIVVSPVATLSSYVMFTLGWTSAPEAGEAAWRLGILVVILLYLLVHLKRAYAQSWPLSFAKAGPAFISCVLAHLAYRAALIALTLTLI